MTINPLYILPVQNVVDAQLWNADAPFSSHIVPYSSNDVHPRIFIHEIHSCVSVLFYNKVGFQCFQFLCIHLLILRVVNHHVIM